MNNTEATLTLLRQQIDKLAQQNNTRPYPGIAYLHALLDRAEKQRPAVTRLLLKKAGQHLDKQVALMQQTTPAANEAGSKGLQLLKQLNRTLDDLKQPAPEDTARSSLAMDELLYRQETGILQQSGLTNEAADQAQLPDFTELRGKRLLRERQLQLFAEQLVQQATANAPANPGPLNPQMLAIRSLQTMQELSPHYLSRFASQMDTLFLLEQAASSKAGQKPKSSR